jgi:signal peptidase II
MNLIRKPIVFILVLALGIGADLLSKKLVFAALAGTWTYPLIPGVLQLNLAENPGVAFSLLAGRPGIIIAFTSLSVLFLFYLYSCWRLKGHVLSLISIAMLIVGAAGNLYDRIQFGIVRDFIDFMPTLPVVGHWAIFNLADICITLGVILFLIAELFLVKSAPSAPRESCSV